MSAHRHHTAASTANTSASSMNILSSILRAPYPSTPKSSIRTGETSLHTTLSSGASSERGRSPIRIITTGLSQGREPSPMDSSLSPSRVPTTLPPKKGLSPSRTIYTTAERHSPSLRANIAASNHATTASSTITRSSQLLSHLPYLAQTLQQKGGISHDDLFQQYKSSSVSGPPQGSRGTKDCGTAHGGYVGPSVTPKPAHQSSGGQMVAHVSTIRRTPSPAHMHTGQDMKAKALVEHSASNPEAVNLIKTSPSPPSTQKPAMQAQWSDQDLKYSDLLSTINRQQETVILPHLQQGLLPITPADQPLSQSWIPAAPRSVSDNRQSLSHTGHQSIVSSSAGKGVSATISHTGLGLSSHHMSSSFLPVSSFGSPVSSMPSAGFQPVVLPSHTQKPTSPKGQRQSPKTSIYGSSHHSSNFTSTSKQTTLSYIQSSGPNPIVEDVTKVFPKKESLKYTISTDLPSVTQAGPPNITISSCGSIIPIQEKSLASQKLPKNPFTFPATPPASVLANEKPHFSMTGLGSAIHSKLAEEERKVNQKERHCSDEMPCLDPVSPVYKEKKTQINDEGDSDLHPIPQPYNMRFHTLANFPNNSTYRPSYRAISVAIQKAKVGCITSPAKSLDILRQNLQKSINKEIGTVIKAYMDKFFHPGISNIKLNNGENSVTEDHVQTLCRQILEEAKKMYTSEVRGSISPAGDQSDNVSETGSSGRRSVLGRRRHPSDTDSEAGFKYIDKKKKGPYKALVTGRSTPSKLSQAKREGPKFDPERLNEETQFVMGSRANKAMGFGATRGRLYMKHPDLFKYSGDQDDKTWLYENQHMPATGGKSYILVLQDITELLQTDEYKDAPGINISSLVGFTVPMWMIEKMRAQMVAMRTDIPKQAKYRSRSATPNEVASLPDLEIEESPPKALPFTNFQSPPRNTQTALETSSADDLEFLSTGDTDNPSPFTITGGFDDTASQSDLDTLDDDTSIEPVFSRVNQGT